jgi:hypothetical protein
VDTISITAGAPPDRAADPVETFLYAALADAEGDVARDQEFLDASLAKRKIAADALDAYRASSRAPVAAAEARDGALSAPAPAVAPPEPSLSP